MIIGLLCTIIFSVIVNSIAFLPALSTPALESAPTATLIAWALNFFPPDLWAFVIQSIGFWYGIMMLWAVIEWVYKKIPGVD